MGGAGRGLCIDEVELATLEWVQWWNASRLHIALGGLLPVESTTPTTVSPPPASWLKSNSPGLDRPRADQRGLNAGHESCLSRVPASPAVFGEPFINAWASCRCVGDFARPLSHTEPMNSLDGVRAVLFDMDGTLVDSDAAVDRAR
jgi:hypothetical protein